MSDYESRLYKKATQILKEDRVEKISSEGVYEMWEVEGSSGTHVVKKETHSNKFSCDCQFNTTHVREKSADTKGTCSHIVSAIYFEGIGHLSGLIEEDLLNLISKWRTRKQEMEEMSDCATSAEKVQSFAVEDCIEDLTEVLLSGSE